MWYRYHNLAPVHIRGQGEGAPSSAGVGGLTTCNSMYCKIQLWYLYCVADSQCSLCWWRFLFFSRCQVGLDILWVWFLNGFNLEVPWSIGFSCCHILLLEIIFALVSCTVKLNRIRVSENVIDIGLLNFMLPKFHFDYVYRYPTFLYVSTWSSIQNLLNYVGIRLVLDFSGHLIWGKIIIKH